MKKLKLELEQLTVDSFDTATPEANRGTVMGEQGPCTCPTACSCPGCPTCDNTCNQPSCGDTCYNTCYPCGTDYGYTCDYSLSRDPFACQCCPL
jgi:hypothetical protein